MYVSLIFLSSCFLGFTAGSMIGSFDRSNLGITNMTDHPIPADTISFEMDRNSISRVPSGYFVNVTDLFSIYLEFNDIWAIDDYAFAGVPHVYRIELELNSLQVIREHMFAGLTNLRILNLYWNDIHTVEPGSFRDTTNLGQLALSRNSLQTLPESMFVNHTQRLQSTIYQFGFNNNPLVCNQSICWVKEAEGVWITVHNYHVTYCSAPAALTGIRWDRLDFCDPPGQCNQGFPHKSEVLLSNI